mmetsp:Transcript_104820/g.303376  ORF Transcript_104820/g.303376 Transcript_104820/m.303376 type:complete len:208 (-) Transcript_104820:68-691(-)
MTPPRQCQPPRSRATFKVQVGRRRPTRTQLRTRSRCRPRLVQASAGGRMALGALEARACPWWTAPSSAPLAVSRRIRSSRTSRWQQRCRCPSQSGRIARNGLQSCERHRRRGLVTASKSAPPLCRRSRGSSLSRPSRRMQDISCALGMILATEACCRGWCTCQAGAPPCDLRWQAEVPPARAAKPRSPAQRKRPGIRSRGLPAPWRT